MRLALTTKITLTKHRATWVYTAHNDHGGSFTSNHAGSKKVALHKAALGVLPGEMFELVTNGRSEGVWTKASDGALGKVTTS